MKKSNLFFSCCVIALFLCTCISCNWNDPFDEKEAKIVVVNNSGKDLYYLITEDYVNPAELDSASCIKDLEEKDVIDIPAVDSKVVELASGKYKNVYIYFYEWNQETNTRTYFVSAQTSASYSIKVTVTAERGISAEYL